MSKPNRDAELQAQYEELKRKAYIAAGLTETKTEIDCDHDCTSNCRREGCNCEHGEWHGDNDKEIVEWIGTRAQWDRAEELLAEYVNA